MTRYFLSLFACGLACLVLSASAPQPDKKPADKEPPKPAGKVPKDTCVKPCHDCAAECAKGVKHASEHKMDAKMIHAMQVCHHACGACAFAVASKNARAWEICELCEKICLDCAAECEKSKDEHMMQCAKACRECAKACAEARK